MPVPFRAGALDQRADESQKTGDFLYWYPRLL